MKKNRKFKKCCSLALAGLIALELSGTALAAESTTTVPTLEEELATLERQLAELENSLRKEQDKTVEQKKEADNKLDKWNIAGDVRVKWENSEAGGKWKERARLSVNNDINEKMSFYTRWSMMEDNEFGLSDHFAHKINTNNTNHSVAKTVYPDLGATDSGWVSDAYLKVKDSFGANEIVVGRFGQTFGATGFWADEDAYGGIDGIKMTFGNKAKVTIGYANFGANLDYPDFTSKNVQTNDYLGDAYLVKPLEEAYFLNATIPIGNAVTLHGMMLKEKEGDSTRHTTGDAYIPYYDEMPSDYDLRGVGVTAKLDKNFTFVGDYMVNAANHSIYMANGTWGGNKVGSAEEGRYVRQEYDDQKALYLSLRYKGAKWGDQGSFGMNLDYRDIDAATRSNMTAGAYYSLNSMLYNPYSSSDNTLVSDGIKGPVIGFQYMITKDIMLQGMHAFNNKQSFYDYDYGKVNGNYTAHSDLKTEDASNYTFVSLSARF
ncbi:hypothetical protein [Anaerosinus sp.]|uniref:hypothetical protein n=1 Tax=Selenobaculum sp. TaxID=3074374 RepID=UPI0015ABB6DC